MIYSIQELIPHQPYLALENSISQDTSCYSGDPAYLFGTANRKCSCWAFFFFFFAAGKVLWIGYEVYLHECKTNKQNEYIYGLVTWVLFCYPPKLTTNKITIHVCKLQESSKDIFVWRWLLLCSRKQKQKTVDCRWCLGRGKACPV